MSGKMNLRDKLENDTLDLSMSDLEQVPVKEIAALKRCYHLDLSNNILTTLPKNFATLTQIVKLDLSKNMLTEIPENFGELRALKHLDLYSNRISRLPLSLGELKNLKWLDLKENPLTPAVASVAGPCSNANECQACAKKIVNYLANVKLTVEEEKKRRLEAAPVEEKKATSNKKEGKKKKKNVEKKIVEKEKSNLIEDNDYQEEKKIINSNHKQEYYSESKGGVFKSMCQIFIAFTIWLAFIMLFAITAVTLFRLYDKQQSEDILKYIEAQTGVSLKTYHQECLIFLETFLSKIELWVNETKLLSKKIYEDYFVKQFNNLKK